MIPRIHVVESPGYLHPHKAQRLLKRGWKRCCIVVEDEETTEKIVSTVVYLPPAANKDALARLLELWAV